MDVRCHSDAEAARVSKNAHKESRESKGSEGNLPAAFLKEPQGAFSASGAAEDCNKSKSNSAADPDYCRRILVRGRDGQGFGARSLGATPEPELCATQAGGEGLPAGTSEKVAGPPRPGSGRPLGTRTGARALQGPRPSKPRGAPPAGLLGEPRGCAGGPRLQAAASDPGKEQEPLEDLCAPCGRRTCREPVCGLNAPKGSAGTEEQPPTAGHGPASWRAGPRTPVQSSGLAAAAGRSRRAGLPGRGCHLGARLGPVLLRDVRLARAAALVRPGPGPAPPPPATSPGPAGPDSVPPPSAARPREGRKPRGGGGERRSAVWSTPSTTGAVRTRAGQCGNPHDTGDPDHAAEAPKPEGTSADLELIFFLSLFGRALQRPSPISPPMSGVELASSPPPTQCLCSLAVAAPSRPPASPQPPDFRLLATVSPKPALAREVEGDGRVLAADISPSPDAKGSIREIILPKGLDLDRPKRTRTSFTAEQLYRLEMEFQRCQYVVGRERTELARQLNLSETQVPGGQAAHSSVPASFPTIPASSSSPPRLALGRSSRGGGRDREDGEKRPKAFSPSIRHLFPPNPQIFQRSCSAHLHLAQEAPNPVPLEFFLDPSLENSLLASAL